MRHRADHAEKRRSNIKWSPDEAMELLAQLDFVVESLRPDSGRTELMEQLRGRLMMSGLSGKKLHPKQIDTKLKLLNRTADPKGTSIEEIYRFGSSRMEGLESALRLRALERLDFVKTKELYESLKSPRQLRSATPHPSFELKQTPTKSTRRRPSGEQEGQSSKLVKNELPADDVSNGVETERLQLLMARSIIGALKPKCFHDSYATIPIPLEDCNCDHRNCGFTSCE